MHEHARLRPVMALAMLLVTLSLLVGVPAMAQDSAGVLVTDPTSGVSVTMPGEPEVQEQPIPGTGWTVRIYLAGDDGTSAAFYVFEVPGIDGGYDLDGGVQGSADGTGGTVVMSTPIVHQGHEGRDFELAVNDPSTGAPGIILSRLLWTGQDVVQLQAVGRDTDRTRIEELFADLVATLDLGDQAIASPAASGAPEGSPAPSEAP